jgi:quinoprotein glucose dehydrogenase
VAVDLKTGQRKWHYQLVHHTVWNFDIATAPILADIVVNGKPIKAVSIMSKQAFIYVFDRATGQPVWPIEERPVPKGDVPGEWYSPTQPFPSKPPADELVDFTPELRAEATKIVSRYKLGHIFTPPVVSKAEGPLATLRLWGGTNWPGGAFDPQTHTLFMSSEARVNAATGLIPSPNKEVSDMNYLSGNALVGYRYIAGPGEEAGADAMALKAGKAAASKPAVEPPPLTVQGLPLVKPPYGKLNAVNLDRGEIVWQVPNGETPDVVRNHPMLKGKDIPRTGQNGTPGVLVTSTLAIVGESQFTTTASHPRGAMLRAYDKATGKEVGAVFIPAPQSGSPMTYQANGKQYIVVAVSGGNYSGEYVAFALPSSSDSTSSR